MTAADASSLYRPATYTKFLIFQLVVGGLIPLSVYLMGHGRLDPGPVTTGLGYAGAVAAVAGLVYAFRHVRPQMPVLPAERKPDQYFDDPAAMAIGLHLWIVCGGTGVSSWFLFGYTAVWAAAVMGLVSFVLYLSLRPSALAAAAARRAA